MTGNRKNNRLPCRNWKLLEFHDETLGESHDVEQRPTDHDLEIGHQIRLLFILHGDIPQGFLDGFEFKCGRNGLVEDLFCKRFLVNFLLVILLTNVCETHEIFNMSLG